MSRSKKKNAVISDYSRNTTRYFKNQASRAVRRYKGEITDGGLFKKIYPSWNIFDYKSHSFKTDVGFSVTYEQHLRK